MATPEQQQEILSLRERQLTPKQIARKLGLRPAEVKAVIKAGAIETESQRLAPGRTGPPYRLLVRWGNLRHLVQSQGKGARRRETVRGWTLDCDGDSFCSSSQVSGRRVFG